MPRSNGDRLPADAGVPLVLLRAGGEECALRVAEVREVLRCGTLRSLHDAPAGVVGALPRPEGALPVLDLGARAGREEARSAPDARVLVLAGGGVRLGLLAEHVREVTVLPRDHMAELPALIAPLAPRWLLGLVRREEAVSLLIDAGALLEPAERDRLRGSLADAAAPEA